MSGEPLKTVLGPHGQVADLRSGAVPVPGFDLEFVEVKRMPDAYRDMARTQPYAVSEMAPSTYLMALAAGAPLTALPIPMTRRFRHAGIERRADVKIAGPKDLEGRTVGVRNYSVSAAVWTRGVYRDEFGVDPLRVNWLTEEAENVTSYAPPRNVQRVAEGQTLAGLMARGDLDFAFAGLAGAGAADVATVDVVPDAEAREADWYRRTGIYPLHGVIVVRNNVLAQRPDLPRALWSAFAQAKAGYLDRVRSGAAADAEARRYRALEAVVGDPLPYGLEENAKSLDALLRYANEQGLIDRRPAIDRVFVDPRTAAPGTVARWE